MSDNSTSSFARRVRAAKAREKHYDIRDHQIRGLFLRASSAPARGASP